MPVYPGALTDTSDYTSDFDEDRGKVSDTRGWHGFLTDFRWSPATATSGLRASRRSGKQGTADAPAGRDARMDARQSKFACPALERVDKAPRGRPARCRLIFRPSTAHSSHGHAPAMLKSNHKPSRGNRRRRRQSSRRRLPAIRRMVSHSRRSSLGSANGP